MAKPTNRALRNPRKKVSTVTTNNTPKRMLFTKSLTWLSVSDDISFDMVTLRSSGKSFCWASDTIWRMLVAAFIRFFPPRFLTSSITVDTPKSRAKLVVSLSLKDIDAISPSDTVPFSLVTTKSSSSEGLLTSPTTRTLLRCPPPRILPAETVMFSLAMLCTTSLKLTLDAIIFRISTATSISLSCAPLISTALISSNCSMRSSKISP